MVRFIAGLIAGFLIGIAAVGSVAVYIGHRDLDGWTASILAPTGIRMTCLLRGIVLTIILAFAANCTSSPLFEGIDSASTPTNGHVYLIRGLLGEVFSRGLDQLAENINNRGVRATVHGLSEVDSLSEEIIRKYKDDPSSSPIILIGHSSGGDAIISMAQRMKEANVPVGLAFGFDPTRSAGPVPENVEVFINLFQKYNPIGGGEIKAASGFHGRLINLDLQEHSEIIHITLDKSSKVRALVVDEIIGFAALSRKTQPEAHPEVSPENKSHRQSSAIAPAPNFVTPLTVKYVVPRNEPIELWDSGLRITVRAGENLQTIAAQYGAPAWAIAQINKIGDNTPFRTGTALIVPVRLYKNGAAPTSEPPPQ
jgi:LysM repeat protein